MKSIQPTQMLYCKKDGFPLINIDGQQQCVFEFLNYCIGGKKITDILLQNETIYYVFENGHEIPLLCNCCGKPLACRSLQAERKRMIGRTLLSMSWDWEELEDEQSVIAYRLEFSAKENEGLFLIVQTAVSSANKMRHPAGCTQSPQPARKDEPVPEAAARQKKKRRRR